MNKKAATSEFFVVVPPGLEAVLMQELREIESSLLGTDARPNLQGLGEMQIEKGGIVIHCEPILALQLHFFSRIASRIWMRLGRFHATEFFQLEKRLSEFDLAKWVGDQQLHLKVDAEKSKLGQEKRIWEVAKKVWKDRLVSNETLGFFGTLALRNVNDEMTLSLDLTGEHMHRRGGGRLLGGAAPIRENLAAALVRFLIQESPISRLRQVTLVDPMAGSGTLLAEAASLHSMMRARSFAFQTQVWIPKILRSPSFFANFDPTTPPIWRNLIAVDRNKSAIARLLELSAYIPQTVEVRELPLVAGDVSAPAWVICNPPYGERLAALPVPELTALLLSPRPERVAVILPDKQADVLVKDWPKDFRFKRKSLQNGGIPCQFLLFDQSH